MIRGTRHLTRPARTLIALLTVAMILVGACSGGSSTKGSKGNWKLVGSDTPSMLADLAKAVDGEKPIAVTLWRPHWAYAAYDLKDLDDPKGAMGQGDRIWAVADKRWAVANPELAEALSEFSLTGDQLSSLENLIFNENDGNAPKGVRAWLADKDNKALAAGWTDRIVGDGLTITIGQTTDDVAVAVTELWKQLLAAKQVDVNVQKLEAKPLFAAMGKGDVDVFLDARLPTANASEWAATGDSLTKLSRWYQGTAELTIAVPRYVKIDSMTQLDAHWRDFDARIVGAGPDAPVTRITEKKMMPAYGLR